MIMRGEPHQDADAVLMILSERLPKKHWQGRKGISAWKTPAAILLRTLSSPIARQEGAGRGNCQVQNAVERFAFVTQDLLKRWCKCSFDVSIYILLSYRVDSSISFLYHVLLLLLARSMKLMPSQDRQQNPPIDGEIDFFFVVIVPHQVVCKWCLDSIWRTLVVVGIACEV